MAPKHPKDASVFQIFKADLMKSRHRRGRKAAPGSGFYNASHVSSSRGQVVKVVKYTRVRPVGRSVLSTLALGLEVDENTGMGTQVVGEWEDEEARELVERQVEIRRARKREEEDREAMEDEVVAKAGGLTPSPEKGRKGKRGGRKLVRGKKKVRRNYEAVVDAMDTGQTIASGGETPVDWDGEYDADLIKILERNPGAKAKAKAKAKTREVLEYKGTMR